jgi:hypothetical protein
MKTALHLVHWLEHKLGIWQTVAFLILTNIWWAITLQAIDSRFTALTGFRLPDLQNGTFAPALTVQSFQTQIAAYTDSARAVYLGFFVLDNTVPFLAFAPFALLWASLLKRQHTRLSAWLLATPFVLIPAMVGVFDVWENLFYLTAIELAPASGTAQLIQAGFVFGFVKGLCVQATLYLTLPLLLTNLFLFVRRRSQPFQGSQSNP